MQKQTLVGSKEIGGLIRGRRKELGLSQEHLAEILDVSYQQVQRYESGRNKLDAEKLQIVAQALQVPVSYFFGKGAGIVAEQPEPYFSPEEAKLLKYFRRITDRDARSAVINMARLLQKRRPSALSD